MKKIIEKMDQILRNNILTNKDISNGVLTNSFFERTDISENKKKELKKLNEDLKQNLKSK